MHSKFSHVVACTRNFFYNCVIFHCMCISHFVYPHICWYTLQLFLLFDSCKKNAAFEHWCASICLSCRYLVVSDFFVTPSTVACQVLLPTEFPWQEYWSGLPFPSPGDTPDPRIEAMSPALAGRFLTTEPRGKPHLFESLLSIPLGFHLGVKLLDHMVILCLNYFPQ